MRISIRKEVEALLGRKLSGIEAMKVRSMVLRGMVNPHDLVSCL